MPVRATPLGSGHLHWPDLLVNCAYLLAITAFGLSFRKRGSGPAADRSLKTYFLAGNTIPWWAIALSVVSAETSTLTVISIPGVAFAGNFGFLQVVLGYLVGRIVVAALFLPRYFAGAMLTAYQLIDQRFGPVLRKVTAGLFLLTRAAAEGVRVFAVSIVVGVALGTGDIASIALISALTLLYTFEGGLAAVIWTDVVQMAIYVGGTLVALLTLGHHVAGGWPAITHTAAAAGKFHLFSFALNLTQSYTFWAGLLGGTFLTMASHGTDQLMVQRLLAARSLRESQWALLSSGVVIFAQFAFFLLIGAGLWVFYGQRMGGNAATAFRTTDYIFPTFIVREMPTGVAGLLIAAILAAAMSNLSAALNSLSSTTVVDFYMNLRPAAETRERLLVSKLSTVFWAVVLFAVAILSVRAGGKGHVVEIGLSIAAVAYGSLLGVFLLGTLTRFATEAGAAVGMVCGFALNLWLWQGTFPVHLGPVTVPHVAFTWYVLLGAIVTFAVGALASLASRNLTLPKPFRSARVALLLTGTFLLSKAAVAQAPSTAQAAMSPESKQFGPIPQLVQQAIAEHKLPGAVVLVGHGGQIVFEQAFGQRKLAGEPGLDGQSSPAEPMTEDTVFDIASLTKVIVTTTAIGQLFEAGKLDFDAPVERYLPALNPNHDPQRARVTLRLLLTHFSGEPPDVDLRSPWGLAAPDRVTGMRLVVTTPLAATPGTSFVYSDINFLLLGAVVEQLSGQRLDDYAREHIFQPLGMANTAYHAFDRTCGPVRHVGASTVSAYNPHLGRILVACEPGTWQPGNPDVAPTAHDDEGTVQTNPDFGHLLRGTVHDPTARRLGGVAGHAGVFSTTGDMGRFAQALLDRLAGRPSAFPLQRATLELLTSPEQPGHTSQQVPAAQRAQAAAEARGERSSTGDPALLAPHYPAVTGQTLRGFGWDIDSGYSKPRGRLFPVGSFGHTGFTGTSLWLDPGSDTYVILMANAIHPRPGAAISNLRGAVATAAAEALGLPSPGSSTAAQVAPAGSRCLAKVEGDRIVCVDEPTAAQPVAQARPPTADRLRTGVDVLEETQFQALQRIAARHAGSLRLGLLTNQTGLDRNGRRTVDVLAADLPKTLPGARLVTLFSPEHGIFGRQDTEHLQSEVDPSTGLPITSLYGSRDSDRHPAHEQLTGLDAVVIDLQDVGVRFYTYETVVGYFLEAAAHERTAFHHDLAIIVLDRPNPLGGVLVQGPVSDPGLESYTDYMPLPVRHGLTLGELARFINGTKQLDADLAVVPMEGWQRGQIFQQTGLPWVDPSPNLRSPEAALLYPGVAFLEMTNLSVGRGTATPFELFGAAPSAGQPAWFSASAVVAALNARHLPGVRFEATEAAVAEDSHHYPFHGQTLQAVHLIVTDPASLDSPELGAELLSTLHRLYPTQFQLKKAMRLVANRATMEALDHGDDPRTVALGWQPELKQFQQARQPYLLYP